MLKITKKLKDELLKRFELAEGGYRKKLEGAVREKDETATQLEEPLKIFWKKLLQMSGFEESYEGLESLIERNQFFVRCDDETRCFIKQKGKLDLEVTLVQVKYFIESKEDMEKERLPDHKKGRSKIKEQAEVAYHNNAMRFKDKFNGNEDKNDDTKKGQMKGWCFICSS